MKIRRFKGALLPTLMIVSIMTLIILLLSPSPVHAASTSHDPISINGNVQLAAAANGGGSGTAGDPYIIEGYVISATSKDGIFIQNTTDYFIVRDCLIENGCSVDSGHSGIVLFNAPNGRIENNIFDNNRSGIYLFSTENDVVKTNVCSGLNCYGLIWVHSTSRYNNIIGNTCENGNTSGISLDDGSNYNVLKNNKCDNNVQGIVTNTDNNIIENNTCRNNTSSGILVSSGSNNNIVENNTCENSYEGIYAYGSVSNTISNNVCNNNADVGIYLYGGADNNVVDNNICDNGGNVGIATDGGSNSNNITRNTCDNNYNGGIGIGGGSLYNLLENNVCTRNGHADGWFGGIYLDEGSCYNNIVGNVCENNNTYGIFLDLAIHNSDNNIFTLNHLTNNTENNAYDNCNINYWENTVTHMGNYWDDWQPPIHPDADNNGVVDAPRLILGGTNQDNYPLVLNWSPSPDFNISVSPTSGGMIQGGSVAATVSVSPIAGFGSLVGLSASGLPSGVTASFSQSSETPSFVSALTISIASTTPAGIYTITITATDGVRTHTCVYILNVTASTPVPRELWILVVGIIIIAIIIALGRLGLRTLISPSHLLPDFT